MLYEVITTSPEATTQLEYESTPSAVTPLTPATSAGRRCGWVPVQLLEPVEAARDVIERIRALRVSCELDPLVRRERSVDLAPQLFGLALQLVELAPASQPLGGRASYNFV